MKNRKIKPFLGLLIIPLLTSCGNGLTTLNLDGRLHQLPDSVLVRLSGDATYYYNQKADLTFSILNENDFTTLGTVQLKGEYKVSYQSLDQGKIRLATHMKEVYTFNGIPDDYDGYFPIEAFEDRNTSREIVGTLSSASVRHNLDKTEDEIKELIPIFAADTETVITSEEDTYYKLTALAVTNIVFKVTFKKGTANVECKMSSLSTPKIEAYVPTGSNPDKEVYQKSEEDKMVLVDLSDASLFENEYVAMEGKMNGPTVAMEETLDNLRNYVNTIRQQIDA